MNGHMRGQKVSAPNKVKARALKFTATIPEESMDVSSVGNHLPQWEPVEFHGSWVPDFSVLPAT